MLTPSNHDDTWNPLPLTLSFSQVDHYYQIEDIIPVSSSVSLVHGIMHIFCLMRSLLSTTTGFLVGYYVHLIPLWSQEHQQRMGSYLWDAQQPQLVEKICTPLIPLPWFLLIHRAFRLSFLPKHTEIAGLRDDYVSGNNSYDPLALCPDDEESFIKMRTRELNNGRLSMIAVIGVIGQELATGKPIFAHLFG